MTSRTTMPNVEQLAQELAAGRSPVELYEAYTATELSPLLKLELRARLLFAWEFARAASIKNGGRRPVQSLPQQEK